MQVGLFSLRHGVLTYFGADVQYVVCGTCHAEWYNIMVLPNGGVDHYLPEHADGLLISPIARRPVRTLHI